MKKQYLQWALTAGCLLAVAVSINLMNCSGIDKLTSYYAHTQDAEYVGIEKCVTCHQDVATTYKQTGMGHSWYKPDPKLAIEQFNRDATVYDSYSNFYYRPYYQGNTLYVYEWRMEGNDTTHSRTERIDYIVGSGNQTRSYILDRNGWLYEAPITWYSKKQKWDLSPGYEKGANSRFSREIGAVCMNCHNAKTKLTAGTFNRFEGVKMGIDCEKCHGPGQEHVRRMEAGSEVDVGKEVDYSIVNPAKLSADLQMDICQSCHLGGINVPTGKKFVPGLPLSTATSIFLPARKGENIFTLTGHAERLKRSKCFIQSQGKMTCTTCHNPHISTHQTDRQSYNKICQSCHTHKACSKKPAVAMATDSCTACHLTKGGISDIPHVNFTDHYIRVVNKEAKDTVVNVMTLRAANNPQPTADKVGKAYLAFYEQMDKSCKYCLDLAAEKIPDTAYFHKSKVYLYLGKAKEALALAQQAVQQQPNEPQRRHNYALLLELSGKTEDARQQYLTMTQKWPLNAEAWMKLGTLTLQLKPDSLAFAVQYLEKSVSLNPTSAQSWNNLGFANLAAQKLTAAQKCLDKAIQLNPDYENAVENQLLLSLQTRNKATATKWFNRLKKLNPSHPQKQRIQKEIDRL